MPTVTIVTRKGPKTYQVRQGVGFQALAVQHKGAPVEFDCREADCGICLMRVLEGVEGLSPPTPAEAEFLRAMHADSDERLACQCRIFGDVTVKVDEA